MNINRLVREVAGWGVKEEHPLYLQKKVILTNEICLLTGCFILFSGFFVTQLGDPSFLYAHIGMLVVTILTLLFNKLYLVHFSRFFVSFLPASLLLLSSYFSDRASGINFVVFSYIIIGLNLIPVLIFNFSEEKQYFLSALVYNLLLLATYDKILMALGSLDNEPLLVSKHFLFFKAAQIQLWIFVVVSVMFLKRVNKRFETKMEQLSIELDENSREVQAQNEEIVAQNEEIAANLEELTQQQEQLTEQRNYIESQNVELKNYQAKLLDYIFELSKVNTKLSKKQAENKSILNALRANFIMMEFDLDGNVTSATPRTCRYLGIDKKKIIGRHGRDLLLVLPEEAPDSGAFEMMWDRVLTGEAVNGDFAVNIPDRDLCVSATMAPIMDENGESIKILAIAEDISPIMAQQKIIESKNELLEKQQGEIQDRNEELRQQKEEIEAINETLEKRVKERTLVLEQKNRQLAEYAFINAHLLRAPVSSILGLINLMGMQKHSADEVELYKYLKDAAGQLDRIVFRINRAIEMNKEFDREFLRE